MKQFTYITKDGKNGTIIANNAQEALAKAPDIATNSGVQEMGMGGSGGGTNVPSLPSTNEPTKSVGGLTAFSDALDQATNLARSNRNELSLGMMSPFSGTLAASDFNSILGNLNKASEKTISDTTSKLIPDISNASVDLRTFATLRPDLQVGSEEFRTAFDAYLNKPKFITEQVGSNVYQFQVDGSGKKIGEPTLIIGGEDDSGAGSVIDILQFSINNGATPEEAARTASEIMLGKGVSVSTKVLNEWAAAARRLKKSVVDSTPPPLSGESLIPQPVNTGLSVTGSIQKEQPTNKVPETGGLDFSNVDLSPETRKKAVETNAFYENLFGSTF